MKKYIGTKEVNAQPMTATEAMNKGYRVSGYHNDGYEIIYKDGYKSWSPKEVFEEAYKCSDTFADRLIIEHNELSKKYDKCSDFIKSDKFRKEIKENYYAFLLTLQCDVMDSYLKILEQRMYVNHGGTSISTLPHMYFGEAIKALEFGLPVRRNGWNGKGLFVIKQVPAHITSDVIPKMQSLPQSAKDLIMKSKGFVDYTSQCLIYNENTGLADSWVPSISDVFAEDWEIVHE